MSLWPGYKTGEGIEPDLLAQFPLLEEALSAAGIVVWPMIEFEADDALAAGAAIAARDPRVERVIICTPDKDLAQCVRGTRIVQLNRRTRVTLDEAGVIQKFGVSPESIPDYLALVGDAADGYPGLPGWGAKSSAAVLAKFGHLESIPADWREWHVNAANASALAHTLASERDRALLFRTLATLRTDIPLFDDVDQLRWNGPGPPSRRWGRGSTRLSRRPNATAAAPKIRNHKVAYRPAFLLLCNLEVANDGYGNEPHRPGNRDQGTAGTGVPRAHERCGAFGLVSGGDRGRDLAPGNEVWMTTVHPKGGGQRFTVKFVEMTPPRRFVWEWHPGAGVPERGLRTRAVDHRDLHAGADRGGNTTQCRRNRVRRDLAGTAREGV